MGTGPELRIFGKRGEGEQQTAATRGEFTTARVKEVLSSTEDVRKFKNPNRQRHLGENFSTWKKPKKFKFLDYLNPDTSKQNKSHDFLEF